MSDPSQELPEGSYRSTYPCSCGGVIRPISRQKLFTILYRNDEVEIPGMFAFIYCESCGVEFEDPTDEERAKREARESWNLANRKTHELKCWPEPFQAILDGKKTHEIRKNDRGFEQEDLLHLREFEPCGGCLAGIRDKTSPPCSCCAGTKGMYTGRELWASVSYVTRSLIWGLEEGTVVMSIRRY